MVHEAHGRGKTKGDSADAEDVPEPSRALRRQAADALRSLFVVRENKQRAPVFVAKAGNDLGRLESIERRTKKKHGME